jgi:hypothetical protein
MKATIFWIILVFLAIAACSKSNKIQADHNSENPQPVEQTFEREKAYEDSIFRVQKEQILKYGTPGELQNHMNSQQDLFIRYEREFKIMMIGETLPENFPQYDSGMSEELYMGTVKGWFKDNPQLLKPEYRSR